MPNFAEEVPAELQPAAEAALAWINRKRGAQFKLTALVDSDRALGRKAGQPIELGLVLCNGDVCCREQVRLEAKGQSFEVTAVEAGTRVVPPHLDPPVGVRQNWLEDQLERHAFIVLLYYRGLW